MKSTWILLGGRTAIALVCALNSDEAVRAASAPAGRSGHVAASFGPRSVTMAALETGPVGEGSPAGSGVPNRFAAPELEVVAPGRFESVTSGSGRLIADPPQGRGRAEAEPPGADRAVGDTVQSFDSIDRATANNFPPDTVLAVGPKHAVEAVNHGIRIHTKDGDVEKSYVHYLSFFASVVPVGCNCFLFDPRLAYNFTYQRYVLLVLGRDSVAQKSYYFFATSKSSDPLGEWWIYRIEDSANPGNWIDYAGLGTDAFGVYFTGNEFVWGGDFQFAVITSMGPQVFEGGNANAWVTADLRWPDSSKAFSILPAGAQSTAADSATFFLTSRNAGGSSVALYKLTGDRGNEPTIDVDEIDVDDYVYLAYADQKGSDFGITINGTGLGNAVYANRRVYTVLNADSEEPQPSTVIQVMKINVDTLAVEWQHRLWAGDEYYLMYPAIAVHGSAATPPTLAVWMSYTQADLAYASAAVKFFIDHPASGTGPFPVTGTGLASYVALDPDLANRWGDYTGAAYDPTCGMLWGAAEYAGTSNNWRTRISAHPSGGASDLCKLIFDDGFESGGTANWPL